MPPEEQKQRVPEPDAQSLENNVPEASETKRMDGEKLLVKGHATQHQLEISLQRARTDAVIELGRKLKNPH